MGSEIPNWQHWLAFFASRASRPTPTLAPPIAYADVPASVAKSLAIFQLGESGGGTIVEQARHSSCRHIDSHYADAMDLFVKEEHRHADVLADCVHSLGGSLIKKNWTARLFVFGRRLIGLRLKVVVLLAAEVVGICYYHLLATRLTEARLKTTLNQLVTDEQAHLYFHCDFLRSQTPDPFRRAVFVLAWRSVMLAAAIVVFIDHRKAIRDLGLSPATVWRRWMSYSGLAEQLVTASATAIRHEAPLHPVP